MKLGKSKFQSLYHHLLKFHLFCLVCNKVMFCLKYTSSGHSSIKSKIADVAQKYQSFKHISLLGFL